MATWFGLSWLIGKRGARRNNGPSAPARAAIEPLEPRTFLSAAAPVAAPAVTPTISFSATQRIEDVSAFNGYIATGDFTGNGLTDFASTRGYDNNIFIYLNNGDDTFVHAETYHVNDPRGIVAGDFNNDGITDLAVVAENSNTGTGINNSNNSNNSNAAIYILYGQGNGTFSAPVKVAHTRQGFGAITAGDFTNNGELDLAVTNNQAVSIYINQGNSSFASGVRYSTGIGNAAYISAADLNGDGVPDLVVGKGNEPFISVLMGQTINGTATGAFDPFTKYHTRNLPVSVAVGDLGPSTLPDIVVGNNGFRQGVSILTNNGDGTFAPQNIYQAGNFVRYVATGDFSGNGTTDIASTDFDGPLFVFPNNGDGTFATPQLFESGKQGDFLTPIQLGTGPESLLVSHSGDVTVLLNTTS
jgi:hypothetical protein